jgi:hypothetical protein
MKCAMKRKKGAERENDVIKNVCDSYIAKQVLGQASMGVSYLPLACWLGGEDFPASSSRQSIRMGNIIMTMHPCRVPRFPTANVDLLQICEVHEAVSLDVSSRF